MKKDTKTTKFLDLFPEHVYRFIDQTGAGRPAVASQEYVEKYNLQGYEAYFTVNGFKGAPDQKREHCTNLNAFFVDIDGRKDLAELEKIKEKLEPTFIIETMRGYHIYWCLDEIIYKDEVTDIEWSAYLTQWERIAQTLVTTLNTDKVVKDVTRILRIPDTYYWKKSGDAWTKGVAAAPFKIKGIHKNLTARYSMDKIEEVFPYVEEKVYDDSALPITDKMKKYAEAEKEDFFKKVDAIFPIEQRESFIRLTSGEPGTLPVAGENRNHALLIAASMMRRAGWSKQQALSHINKVGWHGIEKEHGGAQEIANTIDSAYRGGYIFSIKNEVISHNMTVEEEKKMADAYTDVLKARKEVDKTRFANYEYEVLAKFPYLKKNEAGVFFNYENGVYKMMAKQDMESLILTGMYEDMLWGYRTKKSVSDKVACLLSITPDLVLTPDKGIITNVKNGLLNIVTRQLKPHTPNYVSLVQSPVEYDPNARAATWIDCVHAWMEGDEETEKTRLLQQYAGYCLSSSMKHSKALFLVGDGGNGKSTFADTISMVIGQEGVSRIDLEDIYGAFGLAGLIGKRLNIVEEVSGNYYQSHKLKKLVSGEEVTINMKYKEQFKFQPQAKFIFAVNTMPQVDDSSVASERRIVAVQFNNNFRARPNTELRYHDGALAKELQGILNWMLDGVASLRETGEFIATSEQKKLLADYREENSSVEGFIKECLEFTDENDGDETETADLYEAYKLYCHKDGRKHKKKISFTKELKAYSTRHQKGVFVDRQNGHEPSKFLAVKVLNEYKSAAQSYKEF